jgi:hypothetical protein
MERDHWEYEREGAVPIALACIHSLTLASPDNPLWVQSQGAGRNPGVSK